MDAPSLLPIIGTFAIAGGLWAVARLLKRAGPTSASDWGESAWGDVPAVPSNLFHSGTHTPEA